MARIGIFAIALVVARVIGAVPTEASAAEPAGSAFWTGCYRLTFGDDATKTRVVRLTSDPVAARPGSFTVESVPPEEGDLGNQWRATGPTSMRIGMSNGVTGWSADLRATDGVFRGTSHWVDAQGGSGPGYEVTATSIACDAAGH